MACAWGPILLGGAAFAVTPQVTPETMIQMLRECQPTWLAAGVKQALLKLNAAIDASGMKLDRVRGVWSINAAKYAREALGVPGCHIFGMAEGLIMFTRECDPVEAREQTVGKPVCELDQIRLLKPGTEDEVKRGEVGELAIKGPYTIHGYYDAAEKPVLRTLSGPPIVFIRSLREGGPSGRFPTVAITSSCFSPRNTTIFTLSPNRCD